MFLDFECDSDAFHFFHDCVVPISSVILFIDGNGLGSSSWYANSKLLSSTLVAGLRHLDQSLLAFQNLACPPVKSRFLVNAVVNSMHIEQFQQHLFLLNR